MDKQTHKVEPEFLRQLITDSKLTIVTMTEESGVASSIISRFVRGERGLNFQSACKLLDMFGYELVKAGG